MYEAVSWAMKRTIVFSLWVKRIDYRLGYSVYPPMYVRARVLDGLNKVCCYDNKGLFVLLEGAVKKI